MSAALRRAAFPIAKDLMRSGNSLKPFLTAQLFLRHRASNSILLGRHTDSGFFPGRCTGLCTIIESGEDPQSALVRAAKCHGLNFETTDLNIRAVLEFLEDDASMEVNRDYICQADLPRLSSIPGLTTTEQVQRECASFMISSQGWNPEWVAVDSIPYGQMPVDDAVWYPPFLEGKRLAGRFSFSGRMLKGCVMYDIDDSGVAGAPYADEIMSWPCDA